MTKFLSNPRNVFTFIGGLFMIWFMTFWALFAGLMASTYIDALMLDLQLYLGYGPTDTRLWTFFIAATASVPFAFVGTLLNRHIRLFVFVGGEVVLGVPGHVAGGFGSAICWFFYDLPALFKRIVRQTTRLTSTRINPKG